MKLQFTDYFKSLACGIAVIGALGLTACDEVDDGDRFIELPAVEMQRTVFLEEFTGQLCLNCPNAHTTINQLLDQYKDNLVAVSVHAGGNAFSIGEELGGLRNAEGEALAAKAGTYSYPTGQIDRTSGLMGMDGWSNAIRTRIEQPSVVDIELNAALSADGKTIDIETVLQPTDNLLGALNVWIVESGITAMQLLPTGGVQMDYVHNHVFRATANSVDGEPVSLVTRQEKVVKHTVEVRSNWNAKNLSVVAFLTNDANTVEQAAYTHVATGDDQHE